MVPVNFDFLIFTASQNIVPGKELQLQIFLQKSVCMYGSIIRFLSTICTNTLSANTFAQIVHYSEAHLKYYCQFEMHKDK